MRKTRSDKSVKRGKYKPRAFTDFQTKEKRLAKPKPYSKDFMREDGDDCFGFSDKEHSTRWTSIFLALLAGFVLLLIVRAIQADCIASNGINLCD